MTERLRLDMHTHTEFSPDSRASLAAFAEGVRRVGLDVVCVTDHNTTEGALLLRERDPGFRVVVGEEILSRDGEIVGLFLERTIVPDLTAEETIKHIHDQGGLAYVPHPFSRNRMRHIRRDALDRIVPLVDALEVFNAREAFHADNRRALAFAAAHGLPGGVGSDAHRPAELGRAFVEVPPFATAAEMLDALRSGTVNGRLSGPLAHVRTRYDVLRKWLRRRGRR